MKRACAAIALAGTLSVAGLVALGVPEPQVRPQTVLPQAVPEDGPPAASRPQEQPAPARRAEFGPLTPSADVRRVADVVVGTGDHDALPFLIIDKGAAYIYVFDAGGRAEAAAPVLLGIARGDRFAPGSAEKDMHDTSEAERITPAGRFLGQPGLDDKGRHVVWIQYDAGISLHAVLDGRGERRRQRLATPTPDDNRISFGCVNLPTDFYRGVVRPLFERTRAVVYVLPDNEDALEFFATARGWQPAGARDAPAQALELARRTSD